MSSSEDVNGREDRRCANIIKGVHADLRKKAQNDSSNVEEIWDQHLLLKGQLTTYSEAMQALATDHWEERGSGVSRITWVVEHTLKFLFEGDRLKFANRIAKFGPNRDNESDIDVEEPSKYFLLDVGSCYNPFAERFKDEPRVEVTAIDLQPAQELRHPVYKCDFYRVPLGDTQRHVVTPSTDEIASLGRSSFDVVVFCLLLEYLPLPAMRHDVCLKAWQVLTDWGLLLIVTPDSSHQAKNELQMKCWRLALLKMGFARVYTEKLPHARCLGFIKVPADLQDSPYVRENIRKLKDKLDPVEKCRETDLMFIPQDETTRQKHILVADEREDNTERTVSDSDLDFLSNFSLL